MSIYVTLIRDLYVPYFSDETKNGFNLLCSTIAINILNRRYHEFLSEGIAPLEALPKPQKEKYWNEALKHQSEKDERIMAYKSAYALELITGKND